MGGADPKSPAPDSMLGGRIKIRQPRQGYRFSLDAVLLAHFARVEKKGLVAELGAGSGVVSLILARRFPEARFTLVEIQETLCELARENVRENGLCSRMTVHLADFTRLPDPRIFSSCRHVVANPPFYAKGSGRVSPVPGRAAARSELFSTVGDLVRTAGKLLGPKGRFTVIYPAHRIVDLFSAMRGGGIEPKRLRMVQPGPGKEANLCLVEGARAGGPGLAVLPPLTVHEAPGRYSKEIQDMLEGTAP